MGDRDGVVDRRPVPAVALAVEPGVEPEQVGEHARHGRPERVELGDLGVAEDRLVGHVEADHRDREAAAEHDARGLRVHPDVELGGGRPVALAHGAAHEADVLDPGGQRGRRQEELGDVRQRPGRDQGHGLRRRLERRPQERERALGPHLGPRLRKVGAVEAALPVDVVGDLERPHERRRRAGRDGHVRAVEQREHPERVARRLAQPDVAADGRDPQDLELRAGERERDRERVVVSRVAVEQDRDARGYGRLPNASISSVANRAPSITIPTSAFGVRPSRLSR